MTLEFLPDPQTKPLAPLAVIEFETYGPTITNIRSRATELVTHFADGNPFQVMILNARPQLVVRGEPAKGATWEAEIRAVIYPAESEQ